MDEQPAGAGGRNHDGDEHGSGAAALAHDVTVVEHHRFTQAMCSCGWVGLGRRHRDGARQEAVGHALRHGAALNQVG